ncbi:MAG: class I mannose-6-phosphate isomerase [Lentimicrobium sp.]|jgi:mannose-6-phosphate isomerase|nr:class I mannose-6-phosphate isomerase [Lentimicrobium sp.]
MDKTPLYPLQFEPVFQYRLWGGRHLAEILTKPLPGDDPIGEAWLLSDRDDFQSKVVNGNFKGRTIRQLMETFPEQLMGKLNGRFDKFPLLLKFLDAQKMLSVQVHPSDDYKDLLPPGETGKTEAWVVLQAEPESRICAGLKPGTTATNLRESISNGTVESHLSSFTPKPGDAVFIPAGTVHSLGGGLVVFEVQRNSDVTFRLFDWNHVDAKTSQPRPLQIDQALECINYSQGAASPVTPREVMSSSAKREQLFDAKHFELWRINGQLPFFVGAVDEPRILVCIDGQGELENNDVLIMVKKGDVFLLPAEVGMCSFHPEGIVNMLEIAIPE